MSNPKQQIRFCTGHDGTSIAYAKSGSGKPIVKAANWLSHLEFDWESPVWSHMMNTLSQDHTLLRYDERGCCLSGLTLEKQRLTNLKSQAPAKCVVAALRLEQGMLTIMHINNSL